MGTMCVYTRLFLIFYFTISLLPTIQSLFEDQIGVFDWNQKFIGEVQFVEPKLLSASGVYLFGSKRNAVASVYASNGSIAWRHVLEDTRTLDNLIVCDKTVVSFSGSIVRAWAAISGSVFWENLSDLPESPICQCGLTSNTLFCAAGTNAKIFNLHNGNTLWTDDISLSNSLKSIAFVSINPQYNETHNLITVIGTQKSDGNLTKVNFLVPSNAPNGMKLMESVSVRKPSTWATKDNSCLAVQSVQHRSFLVCVDLEGNVANLQSLALDGPTNRWMAISLDKLPIALRLLSPTTFIALMPDTSGGVYSLDSTGNPQLKFVVQQATFASSYSFGGFDYLFTGFQEQDQTSDHFLVSVYDLDTGKPSSHLRIASQRLSLPSHHGAVKAMHPSVFRGSDGSLEFRVLLQTDDHAILSYLGNGQLQWLREEALADIAAVELVDLPVSESQARMEEEFGHTRRNIFQMFVNRLRAQCVQLMAALQTTVARARQRLDEFLLSYWSKSPPFHKPHSDDVHRGTPSQTFVSVPPQFDQSSSVGASPLHSSLTRDTFNLHKMIVVATAVGKLFGIESEKGRVVWCRFVSDVSPLATGKLALFQQRNTAHFPLPPVTTLLMRSKLTNLPTLFSFNPITGAPVPWSSDTIHRLPFDVRQAVLFPGPIDEDSDYIRPLLLLDRNSQVHFYPSSRNLWNSDNTPLYLYTVEPLHGRLTGYQVHGSPDKQTAPASLVWQMQLNSIGNDSHRIVEVASRPASEHIHSVGRVLGDRGVLYKYLNPNLIAVLTAGGDVSTQNNAIVLYLIDVVAGRVLYSSVHRRCGEPVNLVVSENWIVYTYYNHKSLRHEATALELFEPVVNGEPCAAYSIPTPVQLFLQNILPSGWFSHTDGGKGSSESHAGKNLIGHKPLRAGSRAIFSSLYRTTEVDGMCLATGASSLIPSVIQQSYIFTTAPIHRAAAVSLTERGITSKSIIFGLQKGALIELPKSMFDPRRVLDMTPARAEEGVTPYAPVLPLSDQSVITFNQSIMGIRSIRTAVTGLESTSLVFAYGLDMFFTRIAPSLTYDLLKEDFDYVAIATVTLGMLAASLVTQRLAARRVMLRAWT